MTSKQFLPHLEAYIKTQNRIASDWNGEDDSYYSEGELYHEEDAQIAKENVEYAEALQEQIMQYDLC